MFHREGIEVTSDNLVHDSCEPLLIVPCGSHYVSPQDLMNPLVNFSLHVFIQMNPISLLCLNKICFFLISVNSAAD